MGEVHTPLDATFPPCGGRSFEGFKSEVIRISRGGLVLASQISHDQLLRLQFETQRELNSTKTQLDLAVTKLATTEMQLEYVSTSHDDIVAALNSELAAARSELDAYRRGKRISESGSTP